MPNAVKIRTNIRTQSTSLVDMVKCCREILMLWTFLLLPTSELENCFRLILFLQSVVSCLALLHMFGCNLDNFALDVAITPFLTLLQNWIFVGCLQMETKKMPAWYKLVIKTDPKRPNDIKPNVLMQQLKISAFHCRDSRRSFPG